MPRTKQQRHVARARKLRGAMSLPEVLLWRVLRGEPDGVKLRRQHPLGPHVLDFFCTEAKVAIEVDGTVHAMGDAPERDDARADWLRAQGIEVVRIPASDVLRSPEGVSAAIVRYCKR